MLDKNKAAGISSQYSKRFLENFYNKLSEGGLLDRFKNLDAVSQHILEFISYLSATSLGEKMETGGFIKKTFGEVIKDAPSEIFKRVYNNLEQSAHSAGNQSGGKNFIDSFLELKKEDMIGLIDWITPIDAEKRNKILKQLGSIPLKKLQKISQYSIEEKGKLTDFIDSVTPKSFPEKTIEKAEEVLDDINTFLKSKL